MSELSCIRKMFQVRIQQGNQVMKYMYTHIAITFSEVSDILCPRRTSLL